jgi:hypothetical protein
MPFKAMLSTFRGTGAYHSPQQSTGLRYRAHRLGGYLPGEAGAIMPWYYGIVASRYRTIASHAHYLPPMLD